MPQFIISNKQTLMSIFTTIKVKNFNNKSLHTICDKIIENIENDNFDDGEKMYKEHFSINDNKLFLMKGGHYNKYLKYKYKYLEMKSKLSSN